MRIPAWRWEVIKVTDAERRELEEEQNILMQMYTEVEVEPEKYKDSEGVLVLLCDRMESNRCVLEGRWLEDAV